MKPSENKPHKYELANILRDHITDFLNENTLCLSQYKAVRDIISCRTDKMKGHLSRCDNCGHYEQSYNSCRNRHCNKCQYMRQVAWVDKIKSRLLPVKYFHLVFTVPESLNTIFYLNQKICYNLIFNIAWSALRDLCNNPQFLGAQTGAIALLHTWSSTLTYHPHIHMLVPAGGLSEDGLEWINAKKTGKSSDKVIEYLACYTNKVAITNRRITDIEGGKIKFRYKNPRTDIYDQEMELDAKEFIRRFVQHILPNRFYKVRYFGIFAAVNLRETTEQYLYIMGESINLSKLEGLNSYEVLKIVFNKDPLICKKCKKGRMIPIPLANTG